LLPPADESPAGLPPGAGVEPGPVSPAAAASVPPLAVERGLAAFRLYWWVSFLVVVADQVAKALVRATLPLFDSREVVPGLVDFTHVHNAGVAFGFLNDLAMDGAAKTLMTTALAALALVGIGFYARHVRPEERAARLGLSLILGGAVGNLTDRLRVGYVVDFVDVYWRNWHFWAFNVADACITIGAVLIFIDLLLVSRHASHTV
jgi:signal peptidase II